MANEPPIAQGAEITFGYNWWLLLCGFALGSVSGIGLVLKSAGAVWYAVAVLFLFTVLPAIFTFRVVLNDDGIFVRYLFSLRRRWIKWYEIESVSVDVLRDFRDIRIEMKDGAAFKASIMGTRNGARLLELLQSVDLTEMSMRVRRCQQCGYGLKGIGTDRTNCSECGGTIPAYDRVLPDNRE